MSLKSAIESLKKNTYRKFMFWLMDTHLYFYLLKNVFPFIRLTLYYPRFNRFRYQGLYEVLQPGDIVLLIDYQKLTSKIIGRAADVPESESWSHCGICVDKGAGKVEIVDMTHEGFRQIDFFTFCKEAERVRIKRVNDHRWDVEKFLVNVWKQQDTDYNWTFRSKEIELPDPRNKNGDKVHKFNYCSQLVTEADEDDILDVDWSDLAGLGVPYISPVGLDRGRNLVTIGDSGEVEND